MNVVGDSQKGTITDPDMPLLAAGMFLANMIIALLQDKKNDFAQARSFVTMIENVHNDSVKVRMSVVSLIRPSFKSLVYSLMIARTTTSYIPMVSCTNHVLLIQY